MTHSSLTSSSSGHWDDLAHALKGLYTLIDSRLENEKPGEQDAQVQLSAQRVLHNAELASMDLALPDYKSAFVLLELVNKTHVKFKACPKNKEESALDKLIESTLATSAKLLYTTVSQLRTRSQRKKQPAAVASRKYNDLLLGRNGNCSGYTLTYLSEGCPQNSAEVSRKARFVQSAHELTSFAPPYSLLTVQMMGGVILAYPGEFLDLYLEAENRLGLEGCQNPYLVGKIYLSHPERAEFLEQRINQKIDDLWNRIVELKAERETLIDELIAKRYEFINFADKHDLQNMRLSTEQQDSLSARYSALETEINNMQMMAESLGQSLQFFKPLNDPLQNAPPELIMQKLGLKKTGYLLATHRSLCELPDCLASMQSRPGKFQLELLGKEKISHNFLSAHVIELSFSPPAFRDPNDIDPKTLEPQLCKFSSTKEMIEALCRTIPEMYGEFFLTFNIIAFEKTKRAHPGNALAGVGSFLLKYPQEFSAIIEHIGNSIGKENAKNPLYLRAVVLANPPLAAIIKQITTAKLQALEAEHEVLRLDYIALHKEIAQVKESGNTSKHPAELVQKWESLWEAEIPLRAELDQAAAALSSFRDSIPLALRN